MSKPRGDERRGIFSQHARQIVGDSPDRRDRREPNEKLYTKDAIADLLEANVPPEAEYRKGWAMASRWLREEGG